MRASVDDRQLVMAVAVSPKRLADGTCGASPAFGQVTDEGNPQLIWAKITVVVPSLEFGETQQWEGEFGACPTTDTALELAIVAPLAGRDVFLNRIRWSRMLTGLTECANFPTAIRKPAPRRSADRPAIPEGRCPALGGAGPNPGGRMRPRGIKPRLPQGTLRGPPRPLRWTAGALAGPRSTAVRVYGCPMTKLIGGLGMGDRCLAQS
jgi:hypothetical protein